MTSWRDAASPQAQTDLDELLGVVLPFAERTIAKYGEMFPFSAAVSADGQIAMPGLNPSLGEHPASSDVLDALYADARADAEQRRAVAFVADVRVDGSDAIRVELEHRDGTALVLIAPYSRSRFKKSVTLGQMTASAGDRNVWA